MSITKLLDHFDRVARTIKWPIATYIVGTIIFTSIVFLSDADPTMRGNSLQVMSVLLGIIGSLYLAYDLLGGINGPLRWTTMFLTYTLVGVAGVQQFILPMAINAAYAHGSNAGFGGVAVTIALLGASIGALSGMLVALRQLAHSGLTKRLLSVVWAGICGGTTLAVILLLFERPVDLDRFYICIVLGFICTAAIQAAQMAIYRRTKRSVSALATPPHIFSLPDAAIGLAMAGLLPWILSFHSQIIGGAFSTYPQLIWASALVSAGFSRYVFWRASNLSKNTLGAVGLCIAIVGTLLQLWEPLAEILETAL